MSVMSQETYRACLAGKQQAVAYNHSSCLRASQQIQLPCDLQWFNIVRDLIGTCLRERNMA